MDEDHPRPPDKADETELGSTEAAAPIPVSGQRIGPYLLLQKLGEGGMGEVWLAEQKKPVFRRVALKLIKLGMDTKQVIARFEAERQALAIMNHPNIAKVFDAGTDNRGRPFFVMEHVKGVPITEHCDRHRLTTRERLELFQEVCEGVQHAHQNAIIHRDLKPSNVLVAIHDTKAVPKIIDFGVAKAIAQKLTEKTMFTAMGVMIGTPEYMSPEQAEMTGQEVDTRTDVYSLGVLLYELLVGALPFDHEGQRDGGFDAIRRRIREDEPSKPSKRLSTLGDASMNSAKRRRTNLQTLRRQLSGDLDWITMRALEKDRARRYGSPSDLAEDIQRHLQHEPVLAGPPSTLYRARKFVRRHRMGVGVAAAGLLVLVAFATTMTVQAERIAGERDKVKLEAETLKRVSDFLTGLFEVSDPSEARGNSITARELLDRGAEEIMSDLGAQPLVQARLMDTIGRVYQNLGLWDQASPLLESALATRRDLLNEGHLEVAESLTNLAWLRQYQGRFKEAETMHLDALAVREAALGREHLDTGWVIYRLGILNGMWGKMAAARALFQRALDIFEKQLGPKHVAVGWCYNDLANIALQAREFEDARGLYEKALEVRHSALPADHPDIATGLNNLGYALMHLGEYDEAKVYFEEALALREKILGPDHPQFASSLHSLGELERRTGDHARARGRLLRALDIQSQIAPDHPEFAEVLQSLGSLCHQTGDHVESEQYFMRALDIRQKQLPPNHPYILETLDGLAALLRDVGRDAEALKHQAAAEAIRSHR